MSTWRSTPPSAHWLAAGLDAHYIHVPARDRVWLATRFALGFDHDATLAMRDTSPVTSPSAAVRLATMIDADVLADQADQADQAVAILEEMTAPPTCLLSPDDMRTALRARIAEFLAEPILARSAPPRRSEVVGIQLFDFSDHYLADPVAPEHAIDRLGTYTGRRAATGWAERSLLGPRRGHGMPATLGAPWTICPPTPRARASWERHHFQPLVYRLWRLLDEPVRHDRQVTRSP